MSSVMKDYASKDPRSVSASLRGKGDGRAENWKQFCESVMNNHHTVSDAQAEAMYQAKCKTESKSAPVGEARGGGLAQSVVECVVGVAAAAALFYCFLHGVNHQ